ncbi:MAG: hypothetical protein ABW194_11535 [Novosphingobium sp.]
MIDLDAARRIAGGEGPSLPVVRDDGVVKQCVVVSRDWLGQMVAELSAAREAAAGPGGRQAAA